MLNGTLELHGLDVEPFVARVVDGTLKRRNIVLSYHRREDLVAYALAELWVASKKYDGARYRSFQQFADGVVRRKVVDFFRLERGRTTWKFGPNAQHTHAGGIYQRERPDLVSFDAHPGGRELDIPEPGGSSDFEAGGIDLRRVLAS